MKVVGIIPARYASTRLPGKPLKDILGHPMIWWVYQRVCTVQAIDEIYVATDDSRIQKVPCRKTQTKYRIAPALSLHASVVSYTNGQSE